ncbi:MAG: YceI family protein [Caldilineales bacterium]|nr:YceI family protein [Caldilineales bacterium]MDW8318783.1 YceI family protein [Anaerolineae bacterium]
MSKKLLIALGVVALIALAALAVAVFRPPEQASAPLVAAPVVIETAPVAAATPTPAPAAATPTEPAAQATPPSAEATPTAVEATPAAAGPVVFEIVPAQSEARFLIDEVLRGRPVRVVGATNQVAGQIAIDRNNPSASQVGLIRVNARTLTTDNEFRNRAIKNQILNTNAYEFVTFQPTALSGLPASVAVGQPFTFQITGDLTIRDVTRSVTFDVTVTPVSETRIEGLATTTFPYRDFGLRIPDSPSVDTVADVVTLELEFVAEAL